MRSLRVCLLLVLIALLPLRGSLAATFLCHEGAEIPASAGEHAPADHTAGVPGEHSHLSMADQHQHAPGTADKCNLCAGLASPACPLDRASAPPVMPVGSSLVALPTVWPASFVPAKLERPPRTI